MSLDIHMVKELILTPDFCYIDGNRFAVSIGKWAFYIPKLRLKLLHSFDGFQHCIATTAPSREDVFSNRDFHVRPEYTKADWLAAYSKSVTQRAAENVIAAQRLHEAGVGPAVLGGCVVRNFNPWYSSVSTITAGMFVENLKWRLPKRKTTENDLTRAGVFPDRINSCLRQQIRGYVSDLNSVVGVMPINAEAKVKSMEAMMENHLILEA